MTGFSHVGVWAAGTPGRVRRLRLPAVTILLAVLVAVTLPPAPGHALAVTDDEAVQVCAGLATAEHYEHPVPATGTVRASMVFVDFPDAAGVTPTEEVFAQLAQAETWYAENSYGQFQLDIEPIHGWRRMSQPSTEYHLLRDDPGTWEQDRDYMQEAADLADADHDFSGSQIIYVVTPEGAAQDYSPAFTHNPGDLVVVDGVEINAGSPLGGNIYDDDGDLGSTVLAHETGHLLGEPDYYDLSADDHQATHRFVGPWDLMGSMFENRHFSAWTKFRLGWLDASRLACLDAPTQETFTLSPTTRGDGLTAIVVPTSAWEGFVLEARHPERADASVCTGGLLVSAVDERRANDEGPLRVQPKAADEADRVDDCGLLHNAPFEAGETFTAPGIEATVSEVADDGSVTVQVIADGIETPLPQTACDGQAVPAAGFVDYRPNVHADAIDCVAWYGIAQGLSATQYGPAGPVNRAQMASFVARLIEAGGGDLPAAGAQGYADVDPSGVHADAINRLAAAGIVRGTSATTYAPGAKVRRDQMATFLVNAYEHLAADDLAQGSSGFTDIAGNTHEANITKAAGAGFARGVDNTTYAPANPVRRDQMASFLTRVLERLATDGHTLRRL